MSYKITAHHRNGSTFTVDAMNPRREGGDIVFDPIPGSTVEMLRFDCAGWLLVVAEPLDPKTLREAHNLVDDEAYIAALNVLPRMQLIGMPNPSWPSVFVVTEAATHAIDETGRRRMDWTHAAIAPVHLLWIDEDSIPVTCALVRPAAPVASPLPVVDRSPVVVESDNQGSDARPGSVSEPTATGSGGTAVDA